ncbi:hypothetical protein Pmani_037259 [Petrolisthes manimaculis]|uniref:Uncharacterized protein n=1 Tax=Petrolisthes manimaculis TaxID=1843537 RepID=A0AAE1TLM3_9EUCA|nr:hypothetical protein Pmani_037259 [Petrolisthes manimaculis]
MGIFQDKDGCPGAVVPCRGATRNNATSRTLITQDPFARPSRSSCPSSYLSSFSGLSYSFPVLLLPILILIRPLLLLPCLTPTHTHSQASPTPSLSYSYPSSFSGLSYSFPATLPLRVSLALLLFSPSCKQKVGHTNVGICRSNVVMLCWAGFSYDFTASRLNSLQML